MYSRKNFPPLVDPSSFTSATFRHGRWPSSLEIRWMSPFIKRVIINGINILNSPLSLLNSFSTHLEVYPVQLLVLVLHLSAHVRRHVPKVADHRAHLLHVLLHLLLPVVICDPEISQSRFRKCERGKQLGNCDAPEGENSTVATVRRIRVLLYTWHQRRLKLRVLCV